MCYFFANAGMVGKQLNSPLLATDSAAQFLCCKVSVHLNIYFLVGCMCMCVGNGLSVLISKLFMFRFISIFMFRKV